MPGPSRTGSGETPRVEPVGERLVRVEERLRAEQLRSEERHGQTISLLHRVDAAVTRIDGRVGDIDGRLVVVERDHARTDRHAAVPAVIAQDRTDRVVIIPGAPADPANDATAYEAQLRRKHLAYLSGGGIGIGSLVVAIWELFIKPLLLGVG